MPSCDSPVRLGRRGFRSGLGACLLLAFSLILGACAQKGPEVRSSEPLPPRIYGPAVTMEESADRFAANIHPENQELHSWKELDRAVRRSIAYLSRKPANGLAVSRPGLDLTWGEMRDTMRLLQNLLPRLDAEPELFRRNFVWLKVDGGIKYTSYYEPFLKASRTPKPGLIPLYSLPPDMAAYKARHGGLYYSRRQIDGEGALRGRGLELAWADPTDIFILQIQGSGRLIFEDGTEAIVNYAGQNGHKYKASGRSLRDFGVKMKSGDIQEQRAWFKSHPERRDAILFDNPSYVFFKWGKRGAIGAMGEVVEGWLSLATDPSYLPLGSIVAYGVNAPDMERGRFPLRGIGFAQDTGGAIKDRRIDIFSGSSERADYVASKLDASGPAWVLVGRKAYEDAQPKIAAAKAEARARAEEKARQEAARLAAEKKAAERKAAERRAAELRERKAKGKKASAAAKPVSKAAVKPAASRAAGKSAQTAKKADAGTRAPVKTPKPAVKQGGKTSSKAAKPSAKPAVKPAAKGASASSSKKAGAKSAAKGRGAR